MGSWGHGPFENDSALDFLQEAEAAPAREIRKLLRDILATPDGEYLDVDDGGAVWAACEVIARSLGRGGKETVGPFVRDLVARLKPKEELRQLALLALPRIAAPETSELAGLWHEGGDGPRFDAELAELAERLEAAGPAPGAPLVRPVVPAKPKREAPKPKPGTFVRIALEDGSFAYGRVLATPFVALYRYRTMEPTSDLDVIGSQPLLCTKAVLRFSYRRWARLGWRRLEGEVARPVVRFRQDIGDFRRCVIFDSTGMVKEARPEECIGLEASEVCEMQHVEWDLLDTIQGRPGIFQKRVVRLS
jgi:hypothetical protein